MLPLPDEIRAVLEPFAPVFRKRVWERAKVLVGGTSLTPGRRTVAVALRVMGLGQDPLLGNVHRVLNRNRWVSLALRPILLRRLLAAFVPPEALVVGGIDEHSERCYEATSAVQGIERDPVRSRMEFVGQTSGTQGGPRGISR
jgi:hypothetical protein